MCGAIIRAKAISDIRLGSSLDEKRLWRLSLSVASTLGDLLGEFATEASVPR